MKHILIVGGTGMLRGVTTHFIDKGHIVSVLARNKGRLKSFQEEYPIKKGRIRTISQDYRNTEKALKKVRETADMFVHIDLAILWIHDTGNNFSNRVKEFLLTHHHKTKVFQLVGSITVRPTSLSHIKWRKSYPDRYREIFLGYKKTGQSFRWLTNSEIAKGTIRAIERDQPKLTIGSTKSRPKEGIFYQTEN